jgi:hypothetical protein
MAGIIQEGSEMMQEDAEGAVMDAAIIAAAQRAEHYEIGAYGTCIEWARLMGHNEAVSLLEQTLEEEKAADKKLTMLAESEINPAAIAQGQSDESDEGEEVMSGASRGRGNSRTSGRSSPSGRASASRRQSSAGSSSRAKAADRRRR